jgi:cobalt-zinc-cadmium efflux system protein
MTAQHHHGVASAGMRHRRRLVVVLALGVCVVILQMVGAALTGSLALLADAGHVFADAGGVALALAAISFGARPSTPARTFGFHRVEMLATVVNALVLLMICAFILWQVWQRWDEEPSIAGWDMLAFATVGLVANLIGLLVLRGAARDSLAIRGAYLEVLGDSMSSVAVILAALIIAITGWTRADALASIAVALLILPRAWSLLREAVDVLLEAAPRGIDLAEVRRHIVEVDGVLDAHDLHVWTITSGLPVLSVHVVVEDAVLADQGGARLLDRLGECLGAHFDVVHCTFQLEPVGHVDHETQMHP